MDSFLVASNWNRVSWSIVCPQTWSVAKDVLEILILPSSPPEFWDCMLTSQTLVYEVLATEPSAGACAVCTLPTLRHSQPHDPLHTDHILLLSMLSLLSVIRQGGCHTGVFRYFRGASQRVTVSGFMMSFGGEELYFPWPTSEKRNFAFCDLLQGDGSGGSQGELLVPDSLTAEYTTR